MIFPGDIVCHKAKFLRSAGWYTDVPKNGRVVDTKTFSGGLLLTVEWSDGTVGKILDANVIRYDRRHLEPA
jgi:hypothetical protein